MKKFIFILSILSSSWGYFITFPTGVLISNEIICFLDNCKGNVDLQNIPHRFEILVQRDNKIFPILLIEANSQKEISFHLTPSNEQIVSEFYTFTVVNQGNTQVITSTDTDRGNMFEYKVENNKVTPLYYKIVNNAYPFACFFLALIFSSVIKNFSRYLRTKRLNKN